jgi:hypothetical protein
MLLQTQTCTVYYDYVYNNLRDKRLVALLYIHITMSAH